MLLTCFRCWSPSSVELHPRICFIVVAGSIGLGEVQVQMGHANQPQSLGRYLPTYRLPVLLSVRQPIY